jgi:hypothetical protein
MARGYPDYFGQSTFNFKGTLNRDYDTHAIATLMSHQIVSLSAKGEIHGGSVFIENLTAPWAGISISVRCDGSIAGGCQVEEALTYGAWKPFCLPVRLVYLDREIGRATFHLTQGFTFGLTYTISVSNGSPGDITVVSQVYWHRVI